MSNAQNPLTYYPALDGVRGWMAIGVVLTHINSAWLPGAMIMMDAFFVISGFLITSIIWRKIRESGSINLLEFWKRRLLRLYPAMVFVVTCYMIIACIILEQPWPAIKDAASSLLYYSNWTKLYNYHHPSLFGHTWSLSVEEQFYLLWPLIFFAAIKFRLNERNILIILFTIAIACTIWRHYLISTGAPWSRLYYALEARMDAFVFGGVLALYHEQLQHWLQTRTAKLILNLGCLIFVTLLTTSAPKELGYFYWQQSLVLALSAMIVLLLTMPKRGVVKYIFSLRLSTFLGERCYSIYLWHWPMIWLLMTQLSLSKIEILLIVLPTTLVLSTLTYECIERHFLSSRSRNNNTVRAKHTSA